MKRSVQVLVGLLSACLFGLNSLSFATPTTQPTGPLMSAKYDLGDLVPESVSGEAARADFVHSIVKLVQDTVDGDSWTGGQGPRIDVSGTNIEVWQTAANQKNVAKLIQNLREHHSTNSALRKPSA